MSGSTVAHAVLVAVAIGIQAFKPPPHDSPVATAPLTRLVWVSTPAPVGGGGRGGGSREPARRPRPAQSPGMAAMTVASPPAETRTATEPAVVEPTQTVALSATPMAKGATPFVGTIAAGAPIGAQGGGSGPGADGDGGRGIGPGDPGLGIGPGRHGETGGEGPPGNGVSWPRLVKDVRPAYTSEAMRARITGIVQLSCVVDRDGTVRDCRLTRSLDRAYGLDEEALRAVTQWRFEPARRLDEPVAVRVAIEMAFSMR